MFKLYIHISLWAKHMYKDKKASNAYLMNIESQTIGFLEPIPSLVYDDLAYDEDPHFYCLEPTQNSWVIDPS